MSRTITVVYQRHPYIYRWLKPLFAARKELEDLGYKIQYQSIVDYFPVFKGEKQKKLEKNAIEQACRNSHDIVLMAFHHSTSYLCEISESERADILKKIKDKCNLLVWLDTADSTGTSMFDVMPYVDLYFKKQILKDRALYYKELYGSRLFCEFYHNLLGIEDAEILKKKYPLLQKEYEHKLRVSWNVALGDLYASPLQMIMHPFSITRPKFRKPNEHRTLDVQYRGNGYTPVLGYPRSHSTQLLSEIDGISVSDTSKRIPKKEYVEEGRSARCILSPFGWGEICGRDFEAMVYGACMIKQSMEDIETFPDLYKPMETYVPLKWDFSDFNDIMLNARSDAYQKIAAKAQEEYEFFFTKEGQQNFAEHFVAQLEKDS